MQRFYKRRFLSFCALIIGVFTVAGCGQDTVETAVIRSPSGLLAGASDWIGWDFVDGASSFYIKASRGNNVYFEQSVTPGTSTGVTVTGLPTDGGHVDMILHTVVGSNRDRVTTKRFESASGTTASESGTLISGFDWSVPGGYSTAGGLIDRQWDNAKISAPDYVSAVTYDLTWAEAYAGNGRYDFSTFQSYLDNYANDRTVQVRLETTSRCDLPEDLDSVFEYYGGTSIQFWKPNYLTELTKFVNQFGTEFGNNPRLIGVYVGIADGEYKYRGDSEQRFQDCNGIQYSNREGWGEFNLEEEELLDARSKGLSLDVFEQSVRGIVDLYVAAFPGNESKLAYMNYSDLVFDTTDNIVESAQIDLYNQLMPVLGRYAKSKGLGNRDGLIENWMGYSEAIYGMQFEPANDPRGSYNLKMNEDEIENVITGRYWGGENEEYGHTPSWLDRYGPWPEQPYRFVISSLRTLQMRRNYVTINRVGMLGYDDTNGIPDPTLGIPESEYGAAGMADTLNYLAKTLGRTKHDTPDAFVVHGERYVRIDEMQDFNVTDNDGENHVRVREFGRWMSEVGNEGWPWAWIDLTEHTALNSQSFGLPVVNGSTRYEYAAKMGNRFTYDIDDSVVSNRCNANCKVEVKVVFNDVTATTLVVENQQGILARVSTTGSMSIKTASFPITTQFYNGHSGGDFTVRSENGEDFPVMLTRVNFLD